MRAPSINVWDDGYPSGGNYWWNHTAVDLCIGLYQNETGSDGICDTSFDIDENNQDRYPLMNPWIPGAPIAYFNYSPKLPNIGEIVTFNASASHDYQGSIITYAWDFGDDNTTISSNPVITHNYTAKGSYLVNLTVTDDDGLSRSITRSITVGKDSTPPTTLEDYDGLWHTTDFIITLTPTDDLSGVAETYYRINGGQIQNLTIHGQPLITTQGAENILEYWSVDSADNEELPHNLLTEIKLDKTAPTIETPSRQPDGDVLPDWSVKVSVNVTDVISEVENVTLFYTIDDGAIWKDLPMNYSLSTGLYETIIPPQEAGTWVRCKIVAYDKAENSATKDGTEPYCVYQVILEFPSSIILLASMIATLLVAVIVKRKKRAFMSFMKTEFN